MWIVRYALSRTYSIGVLAILLVLVGTLSARRMSTDILPSVDTPSVSVIWTYSGLNAREMAAKIASFGELVILNNVDDVLEVRSETTDGVTIIKVDFQPYVELSLALTQINSVSQTILRRMPTGTSPPLIVRNSASSQPVLNLVLSSDTLDDSGLYDFARLQLRGQIQTIPGVRMSLPYGTLAKMPAEMLCKQLPCLIRLPRESLMLVSVVRVVMRKKRERKNVFFRFVMILVNGTKKTNAQNYSIY